MTIVLIKLKWVHYNLNTRLCLNCILMSPNWLRWMLSLVVSNAGTLSGDQATDGLNASWADLRISWELLMSLKQCDQVWCDNAVIRRWMGTGCGHWAVHPTSATGHWIKNTGDNNCLEWNDHDDVTLAQLDII